MARNYGGRKLKSDLKKIYDAYGDNEWDWSDTKKLNLELSSQEYSYLNCFIIIKRKSKSDPRKIYKINPMFIQDIKDTNFKMKKKLLYPERTKY